MIKEIKIENFKSIQSLNLELGRLNVFIGANGSGKSNILEGIAIGSVTAARKLDTNILSSKGVRGLEIERLKSGFSDKESNGDIVVKFTNENQENITSVITIKKKNWQGHVHFDTKDDMPQLAGNVTNIYENHLKFETYEDSQAFKESRYIDDFLKIQEQILKDWAIWDFVIFAPENSHLRNFKGEGQNLGVQGEGLFNHLVDLLKENEDKIRKINEYLQLLDWFEGFEIPKDLMFTERRINIKDKFLEDGLQYIDQRSANEGFLYLLFYLTLLISEDTPKFFAIDNIDNAMNPKLGRELIKTLAHLSEKDEHDKQVILTTHNPAILDGLNLNDTDQRLFVVYRNAYGHTKVTRIFKTETPEGQRPLPLSEQFLRGYLGGLPDNF